MEQQELRSPETLARAVVRLRELPEGTVTLLFTDIEGSTELVKRLRSRYADVRGAQRLLRRGGCAAAVGQEVDTRGGSFFFVFRRVRDAIAAAAGGQVGLAAHDWPQGGEVRVRMGLHTGEPAVGDEGYLGLAVH